MTQIEVGGAAVRALGAALEEVRAGLLATPLPVTLADGLPPGVTASALGAVLDDWARERGLLAASLGALAQAAQDAGAAYLEVEAGTTELFGRARVER